MFKPEAERARPVVGRFQQVIQFAELRLARVLFDDAAAPVVGAGVAQRAEHAIQQGGFVSALGELEFDRIDLNRLGSSRYLPR